MNTQQLNYEHRLDSRAAALRPAYEAALRAVYPALETILPPLWEDVINCSCAVESVARYMEEEGYQVSEELARFLFIAATHLNSTIQGLIPCEGCGDFYKTKFHYVCELGSRTCSMLALATAGGRPN